MGSLVDSQEECALALRAAFNSLAATRAADQVDGDTAAFAKLMWSRWRTDAERRIALRIIDDLREWELMCDESKSRSGRIAANSWISAGMRPEFRGERYSLLPPDDSSLFDWYYAKHSSEVTLEKMMRIYAAHWLREMRNITAWVEHKGAKEFHAEKQRGIEDSVQRSPVRV